MKNFLKNLLLILICSVLLALVFRHLTPAELHHCLVTATDKSICK